MIANASYRQNYLEISWQDAVRLAIRFWPVLVFVPLIVTATSTLIYMSSPEPNRAIAQLNTSSANMRNAISETEAYTIPGLTIWYDEASTGNIVLVAQALDANVALQAVQSVIARIPPNVAAKTELTPSQLLDLRALRQYLQVLKSRLATGSSTDDIEPALLEQEIALVEGRLRGLEVLDVPAEAVPLIVQEASIVPTRTPPLRNVAFFSLLATLFLTWLIIYSVELRRINRLPAA